MNFFKDISHKAFLAFKRFPATLTWSVLGSIYLMMIYNQNDLDTVTKNTGIQLILILGVSWFIAVQFVSEALSHSILYRFVLKLCVLTGLILYYIYGLSENLPNASLAYGQWALLMLAGHVFVVFAPFIKSWNKYKFWDYLKSIIIALVRSGIYTVILYVGLAIAISTLEILFKINFNDNIYFQTFIFCLGVVNTFVYLSDFPRLDKLGGQLELPKAGEVLVLYILIPLSLLYLLIVYVYALKILIEWELPEGFVTYLISGLSLLAFVIHISIEPFRKTHVSKLIQKFYPYYFYAILPLLPLLFVALYRRIADYNFTELRYLGLVLAFWICGMLIYMLVSHKKALSLYAKSMFVLILLCTFYPLSAFKISINAQVKELAELMESVDKKTERSFTNKEYDRFKSIIWYINERNAMEKTKAYFGFNPDSLFSDTLSYNLPRKIVDKLNIKILASDDKTQTLKDAIAKKHKSNPQNSYHLNSFKPNYAENISDYTNYTELNLQNYREKDKALVMYYDDKNIISLRYYDEVLFETDMSMYLKNITDKYDDLGDAQQDEFTFRFKNNKGNFMIIFDRLQCNYTDNQIKILNAHVKLFYRTYKQLEL
ncbi:DUF4153 domain-containing protein [Flavobacterium sp. CS20]|uniref:DUF4153 domain-containing protein n=1 Tax=Flavobacterium sp. CS20 TaxID=2775246 RepID=UPI001B3A3046|nr:DUF4153 domain-containing protein [Flavobacterium sp. CS20]QTY26767.1 DUF4153 domain-containing protein [Flavobacterium sp. CS20]